LKKSTDGVAVKPRVEIRRKIRPVASESSEDDSDASGDADDDGDHEMGDSEGDEDDDEDDDDEDEDEDSEDEGDITDVESAPKKRALGFKAWAQQQMDQIAAPTVDLLNTTSSSSKSTTETKPSIPLPKTGHFVGPLGAQLNVPSTSLLDQKTSQSARPTVKRRPSVAEARMELPILAEEQPIIETILMNPVVVICGETGSGKTTQVPQMLYEHGFGFKSSGKLLYLFTSCFTELTNR
jgi:ATP-dependent RNA helicase DHX37/DHR1